MNNVSIENRSLAHQFFFTYSYCIFGHSPHPPGTDLLISLSFRTLRLAPDFPASLHRACLHLDRIFPSSSSGGSAAHFSTYQQYYFICGRKTLGSIVERFGASSADGLLGADRLVVRNIVSKPFHAGIVVGSLGPHSQM